MNDLLWLIKEFLFGEWWMPNWIVILTGMALLGYAAGWLGVLLMPVLVILSFVIVGVFFR